MTEWLDRTSLPRQGSRARSRARGRRRLIGAALLMGAIALITLLLVQAGGSPATFTSATADARAFLRTYVEPSGRVVRRDQGGDTVSEGQAYALLLAQATGQTSVFDRIWAWTRAHLQLPDGELAYLTDPTGAVRDATPASDADVLTAWALSRATGRAATADHAEARRMSTAILNRDTINRGGRLLLAAGPWATGSPGSLDPSYWAPHVFDDLARFTHDSRWRSLAASAQTVAQSLSDNGVLLPPDWARLDGSTVSATPAPNGQAPQVRYGLDAQRLVVWMAASCDAADRHLAARWWSTLAEPNRAGALALTPDARVLDGNPGPLPLVASAAAAGAAGDVSARSRLLATARRVQAAHPTYYGGAWLALGETLLGGELLGGCASSGGSA